MADTLLLGTRKGLIVYRRDAGGWRLDPVAFEGVPVQYAAVDPRSGTWWAALAHGHWGPKLHRSTDGGRTFEAVAAPAYPEGASWHGDPMSLEVIWTVAPGGAAEPGRLYLGTDPGGLFVTDDGGGSWRLDEVLWEHPTRETQWFAAPAGKGPVLHSVLVDPRDPSRVLVALSAAGVFATEDGGRTWEARNQSLDAPFLPDPSVEAGHDPHLLVRCGADPDVIWQQNHAGIWRSIDNGHTWTGIAEAEGPARFGFAIAADHRDREVAWMVPAKGDDRRIAVDGALCVCRTEDGGRSWTALRRGLPQAGCFDLTLRQALDAAGDDLAFGTTTGNLFVSGDGGEGWTCLSHHLPPIHSVRFA